MRVISADDHIVEPPGIFDSIPNGLRALAPQPVKTDQGDGWQIRPDLPPMLIAGGARASKTPDEVWTSILTFDNMAPGAFDPAARVLDMDLDGVDAQVLYPQLMRHGLRGGPNPAVRAAVARAYNEWIATFDKFDPARFVGLAVLPPLSDGEEVIEILREARGLGLRGAWVTLDESGKPVHHPDYDGFWAQAAALKMPISLHVDPNTSAFGRSLPTQFRDLPGITATNISLAGLALGEQMCHLIFSGIFDKYPDLRVVLAESGAGWIPYVVERIDDIYVRLKGTGTVLNERAPSEIARAQIYATFERDPVAVLARDIWGSDNIMWASDYPHLTSTFPESARIISTIFDGVPTEDKQKMVCDNVSCLYRLSERST
jgi:predicted TIM-barrel fold metal-dependent hydrolase